MFRHLKRILIVALIALTVIAPGASFAAPQAASPDILFSVAYRPPQMSGYLVKGDNKVLYALSSYSGWFWSDNYVQIISRNGFEGNVSLEALNLPHSVTSELPASVFVPKGKSVRFTIHLRAGTDAALVTTTITLRGTSGNIVKTGDIVFTVVEQLPPLPN